MTVIISYMVMLLMMMMMRMQDENERQKKNESISIRDFTKIKIVTSPSLSRRYIKVTQLQERGIKGWGRYRSTDT